MTDSQHNDATPEPKRLGLLAQFAGPDEMIAAAEKVTDSGYKKVEAYSPFAVIGIDDALKQHGTILPWVCFCMGLTGCLVGITMQCYMNGVEGSWWLSGYDYLISGKPSFSIPAFIPVTFELTILLSAFGAFFGMFVLNQLPKLFNPLFRNDRFADVTDNGFFLFVDANDPKYAEAETQAYLTSVGASAVEPIDEVLEGHALPNVIHMVGATVTCLALLLPLYLWMTSSTTTPFPRISFFRDMETQAKAKAQTASTLFDNKIAARKAVPGTIARGSVLGDPLYYLGYEPESEVVFRGGAGDVRFASFNSGSSVPARLIADEEDEPSSGDDAPAAASEIEEKDWATAFPESLKVDSELMDLGQKKFDIYCSTCHGLTGAGDGLITKRALGLMQGTWVQPTSLHAKAVIEQPVGRVYSTISNGIRKMPGYKEQLSPEERWAIVLYIKALQRSQNATADDVPKDKLREISNLK